VEPLGPLPLKGKRRTVEAFRLVRVVEGAPGLARRFDVPLVGRAGELARLRTAFEEAETLRRCVVATVVGDAGIGKTRLANELVAAVAGRATVLVGRCIAYGDGATFLPLEELLAQPVEAAAAE